MKKIKKKDTERLEPKNIEHVISLLEAEKPITKKVACEILNISYNTTRLATIIEQHKANAAHELKMKKKFGRKKLTDADKQYIISEYINGENISNISKSLYRSASVIKRVLINSKVPIRKSSVDYFDPVFLEEDTIKEDYEPGDLVFSARYNVPALIKKLVQVSETHGKVYSIWLLGKNAMFASQPYYELGNLTHVQEYIK